MWKKVLIGQEIYNLCSKMFPYCRSITGDGVRQTLQSLREIVPEITVHEIPSGTNAFDWTVPKEWRIRDAWIKNSSGEKILDYNKHNLHVVGYSTPVDKTVDLAELKQYIYTQPDQPDAIPYVTSYYKGRFGFCMTQEQYDALPEDTYHIFIDSKLFDGSLTYGELIIPGESNKEVLISTYMCHPSMANNELSGPAVSVYLAKWLLSLTNRHYTYRFVYVPETIGSLTYMSQGDNLEKMKANVIAGWNLSCVGDDRTYSYVRTRYGNTLTDIITKNVLQFIYPKYKEYSFLKRGSDERQYNAPGIDLPVCGFCRSKFGEYPEYHTSKDDMGLISPAGLQGAYDVMQQCILVLESNKKYQIQCLGEPQLGKRGLYPTISQKGSYDEVTAMLDFIAYADGKNDLIEISNIIGVPVNEIIPIAEKLIAANLLKVVE
ncbi:aminopeptidase-like domain-containing protein [Anaerovibrio lipolyticus DSM 3074]|uniref:Aminopeptidase-like domain-containing protein n=1 Tax=Anaerovibrio lipolyticus DSM 3074 TaxID=1120997 RepID=A0A1M6FE28_9FIRM|nr:aminopeptidase-like domain-containing protein [Anaerovibrio lipolyticus DSM 3074]